MSHYNINIWKQLSSYVSDKREVIDRRALLDRLKAAAEQFKQSKDQATQQLYRDYLGYFDGLNISDYYDCKYPWYSLNELIQYDILHLTVDDQERPIVKVRDLLWELLAFRADHACAVCGMDMRVLSPKDSITLCFACDDCGNATDLDGNRYSTDVIHYPALYDQIKAAGIEPSVP